MKSMIIVESKAKVQSIGKIVGEDYELHYCLGHIYDLPEKDLGIEKEQMEELKKFGNNFINETK